MGYFVPFVVVQWPVGVEYSRGPSRQRKVSPPRNLVVASKNPARCPRQNSGGRAVELRAARSWGLPLRKSLSRCRPCCSRRGKGDVWRLMKC